MIPTSLAFGLTRIGEWCFKVAGVRMIPASPSETVIHVNIPNTGIDMEAGIDNSMDCTLNTFLAASLIQVAADSSGQLNLLDAMKILVSKLENNDHQEFFNQYIKIRYNIKDDLQ